MRCFLAVPVPEDLAPRFAALQRDLKEGRALPPENLHLTLAFLGDQRDEPLVELDMALQGLATPAFAARFGPLGAFEGPGGTSLHAELQADPPLLALHQAILSAVRRAGITLERRRFHPHVTFARLSGRLAPDEAQRLARWLGARAATPIPDLPVNAVTLYRSHLRPEGSLYEPLADYPLRRA